MLIQTTRFGEVEIQDQDILTFPSGMLGFSAERHFVMIEDEMGSPFHWLQAVEKQDLAFITLNPETAVSDFSLDITCLLYTSPSPRDRPLSRMPSSA